MTGIYAHIVNNVVAEPLVTPPPGVTIDEMFHAGLTWVDVGAVSPLPGPGWTATQTGDAWTFAPPVPMTPPALSIADQARLALMSGVSLVSTGTPALDGVYGIGAEDRADVMGEMLSLMVNGTFTNGGTVLSVADIAGALHEFSVAAYKAYATAIGGYVGALKQAAATDAGPIPAGTLAIA